MIDLIRSRLAEEKCRSLCAPTPQARQACLHLLCDQIHFVSQSSGERCAISTRHWPTSSQFAARLPPVRRFAAMARQPSPPPAVLPFSPRPPHFFGFTISPGLPWPFSQPGLPPRLSPGPSPSPISAARPPA